MSNTFFFLIGRTPELSVQEIQALVPTELTRVTDELVSVELEDDETAIRLFYQLGGSLKVMKQVGRFHLLDEETLLDYITAYLAQFPKPTFGIAELNRNNIAKIEPQFIKNRLKVRNVPSRFIEGSRTGLGAAVLTHQNLIELNVIRIDEDTLFTHTLASQDIDDWTLRDRSKPYSDRKKGMLPPKLARAMVNIARGNWQKIEKNKEKVVKSTKPVLYDPFCGSGTVLLEGLMLDLAVVGSDLDKDAVFGTQSNLDWFARTYKKNEEGPVVRQGNAFFSDATQASVDLLGSKVDLIVTEPFLGKPSPQEAQMPNIFKGLEKLYWGTFRQWTKILQEDAVIVMVFPYVEFGKHAYSLESLIDKLKDLGYTPLSEPIMYARPLAVVQRQVWQFVFHKQVNSR
ncbi:TRM11 family methyltransferase [soil metagenome]